jgi:hypothetical protein
MRGDVRKQLSDYYLRKAEEARQRAIEEQCRDVAKMLGCDLKNAKPVSFAWLVGLED